MSGFSKGLASVQAGFKALGPMITKSLGPIALIIELVNGIMQADKETTELQKSMALSKDEAMGFRMNMASAAASSNNLNITTTKLLKSFSDLNKQFGFITNFSNDALVTMTKLTEVVGVSSESAGNLAAASKVTGTSFESNYKDVLATSHQLQVQSGVQMDLRDILEQTGKVTGTVRANLGANPSRIAAAVTQAKLLGSSLEDVAKAGKSLLDFEASITAELEAELLLGRDINLERARAAALAGDQVTLAQELQREAGNFSDFTKMNVIQQEALAKAMGMTSDQLADILFQQEVQGKSAKELRALGKEELAQRLEAQTLQDKFNATVDKLKGIFADVGTAFMPLLQILGDLLKIVNLILAPLTDLTQLIVASGRLFGGNANAFSEINFATPKAYGIEDNMASPYGIEDDMISPPGSGSKILSIPKGNISLGGNMDTFSKVNFATSTADDMISPPGYGDRILSTPEGNISLNNKDTIVAGTNLMPQTQIKSPSSPSNISPPPPPILQQTQIISPPVDNTETKRTNMLLERLINQPAVFKIGTDEFFTSTSKYSYQIQ
jgi:hypothetical protein